MSSGQLIFFRILDLVCIFIALSFSSWLMLPPYLEIFADYTGASTFTFIIFFLTFYMLDCYSIGREDLRDSMVRLLLAVLLGIIGTGFVFYTFEPWRFPRLMFVLQMGITLFLTAGWRLLYYKYGERVSQRPERIVFFGSSMAGRAKKVLKEFAPEVQVLGYVDMRPVAEISALENKAELGNEQEASSGSSLDDNSARNLDESLKIGEYLGLPEKVLEIAHERNADRILVLESEYITAEIAKRLFDAKLKGLKVDDMRSLYESMAERLPVDLLEDEWLLLEPGFSLNANRTLRRIKRTFDVFFALTLMILTSPIMLITALAVRLESPGAALYSQKRVGLGGREFTVYKIRSMRDDAEKEGAVWAQKNDPRVTRVGKFIRKTRIDELPQLFNVLKGDMSVVGPRPERRDFVTQLEKKLPYYSVRHTVKPGVTGWAQVSYPYGASLEDSRYKLEYDLYYIKNMSLLLEVKIVLKTIGVVLFPKGAR